LLRFACGCYEMDYGEGEDGIRLLLLGSRECMARCKCTVEQEGSMLHVLAVFGVGVGWDG
jgi:hypothetical protein